MKLERHGKGYSLVMAIGFSLVIVGAASADMWSFRNVQTDTPPTIDGVINAAEWEDAKVITINKSTFNAFGQQTPAVPANTADDADLTAIVYNLWDADNWYFAASITDDDWRNRNDGPYYINNTDCVMLWVDPPNADPNVNSDQRTLISFALGSASNGTDEPRFSALNYDTSEITEDMWEISHEPDGNGGTWHIEATLPWDGFTGQSPDGDPTVAIGGEIGITFAPHDWDRDPSDPDNQGADLVDVLSQYLGTDPSSPSWLNTRAWPTLYLVGPADGTDSDGDGLPDADEAVYSTEVDDTDSDGDGVRDEWEVASGTDPLNAEEVPDNPDPNPVQEPVPAAGGVALTGLAAILAALARCRSRR